MEKRKYERKKVAGEFNGRVVFGDRLKILDVSKNGIRFQCLRRMNMNSVHTIKIEKDGVSLDVKGQVVRSTLCIGKRGDKSMPIYEVALTFKSLSQEASNTLDKFISLLGNG